MPFSLQQQWYSVLNAGSNVCLACTKRRHAFVRPLWLISSSSTSSSAGHWPTRSIPTSSDSGARFNLCWRESSETMCLPVKQSLITTRGVVLDNEALCPPSHLMEFAVPCDHLCADCEHVGGMDNLPQDAVGQWHVVHWARRWVNVDSSRYNQLDGNSTELVTSMRPSSVSKMY